MILTSRKRRGERTSLGLVMPGQEERRKEGRTSLGLVMTFLERKEEGGPL